MWNKRGYFLDCSNTSVVTLKRTFTLTFPTIAQILNMSISNVKDMHIVLIN